MKYLRKKRETKYKKSRKNRRNKKNKTKKIKGGFGFLQAGVALTLGYLSHIPSGLSSNSLIAVTDSSGRRPPTLPENGKVIVIKDPENNPNKMEAFDAHAFTSTDEGGFMSLRTPWEEPTDNPTFYETPLDTYIKTPDQVNRHIENSFAKPKKDYVIEF